MSAPYESAASVREEGLGTPLTTVSRDVTPEALLPHRSGWLMEATGSRTLCWAALVSSVSGPAS